MKMPNQDTAAAYNGIFLVWDANSEEHWVNSITGRVTYGMMPTVGCKSIFP